MTQKLTGLFGFFNTQHCQFFFYILVSDMLFVLDIFTYYISTLKCFGGDSGFCYNFLCLYIITSV